MYMDTVNPHNVVSQINGRKACSRLYKGMIISQNAFIRNNQCSSFVKKLTHHNLLHYNKLIYLDDETQLKEEFTYFINVQATPPLMFEQCDNFRSMYF